MAKINEIIREMELLLSKPNPSNSPRGRQLAETYAEICSDVNNSLAECRTLFRMGAYAEARKLNARATPTFVDRYRILNFSRRSDWLRLCSLYNWNIPPELDVETVAQLENTEDEKTEITITELQDQWRRIIRAGSLREKLILARKIYALDPSDIWRSNLLNVERPWVNELKKEADEALAEERAHDLAEIYNELISPELIQKVPVSTLAKYQELVTRSCREKLEQEKKELLDEIATCHAAMILPELEKALSRWSALETNPLFKSTTEEQIQIEDARTFLLDQQAEANAQELFSSLQNQLEQLLNAKADPKEIDNVYHTLQQLERPIKPQLEERMSDLYASLKLEARRCHVRRCIYWGLSVILLAAFVFTGIFLVQQEREFRRDSARIRAYIDSSEYEAALEYCTRIAQERPSIARRPGIEALRKEAEEKLAELQQKQETFERACKDLEEKYLTEENVLDPVVPRLFEELEVRAAELPEAQKARMITLQQEYEDLKKRAYETFEVVFLKDTKEVEQKWQDLFQRMDSANALRDDEATSKALELQAASERVLNAHQTKVREELYTEWRKNFESHNRQFAEKMKGRDASRARTKGLYHPENLASYAQALELIDSESEELQNLFRRASAEVPTAATLNSFYGSRTRLLQVLDQYPQDPFCRDVKAIAGHPDQQKDWIESRSQKLKDLRSGTLEKHYNLFEVVLKGGDNTKYHLYFAPENVQRDLQLEYNWDGTELKAMRFSFVQANNGFKANAVFQVIPPEKKRSGKPENTEGGIGIQFVAGQKFNGLPLEKLTLADDRFLKDIKSLSLAPQHAVLAQVLSELERNCSARNVLRMILTVSQDRTITNVYAKVHLLKQLYSLLPVDDLPQYQAQLKGFSELLNSYSSDREKSRWQDPGATHKYPQEVAEFQKKLDSLDLKEVVGTLIFNELLLECAESRYPVAVGVLYQKSGQVWHLRPFSDWTEKLLQYSTVFVFSGDAGKQNCITLQPVVFSAGVADSQVAAELRNVLYNGQIVYLSGLTSWNLEFQTAVNSLKRYGFDLPKNAGNIVWPESWPVNHRNVADLVK